MQFVSLPVEIIALILDSLDDVDLLKATIVSKKLREIVQNSSKFQYAIELEKRRMACLISEPATPTYASRLDNLRSTERAWKTLNWRGKHSLTFPPSGTIYDFVGGVYAMGQENEVRQLTTSISFMELPSTANMPEPRSWTCCLPDIIVVDFTMDPSQNLLVLVALAGPSSPHLYEVHLRSLTTDDVHPLAPMPVLPYLSKSGPDLSSVASVRIQIAGDLLALLVKEIEESVTAHLEIWDWIHNPQVSVKMTRRSGIEDFTFITPDAFLLVRPAGSLEVYTFPNPITENSAPINKFNYGFPALSDGYMYWYMNLSTNPTTWSAPRSGNNPGEQLYCPRPEDRIYVCTVCVFDPAADDAQRVHCFVFFFNAYSLLYPPEEWTPNAAIRGSRARKHTSSRYAYPYPGHTTTVQEHSSAGTLSTSSRQIHHPSHPSSNDAISSLFYTISTSARLLDDVPISTPSLPYPSHPLNLPEFMRPKVIHTPLNISWSTWGPPSTRWFPECLNSDWQHSVYGMRTVDSVRPELLLQLQSRHREGGVNTLAIRPVDYHTTSPVAEGHHDPDTSFITDPPIEEHIIPPRCIRLRDYNPYSIWECLREQEERGQSESEGGEGKEKTSCMMWGAPRVVKEATSLETRGVFIGDVESRLPYVEVLSKETFKVTDVMMDQCRLLLLQRGFTGVLEHVDILTM
ncbi:hypothetical protein H0H87_003647 [Tephrocybe sp. NHM501043]|nr:hypothetical protein H0H87_003647 [Tephrocybe sp. NHM501043]